MYLPLQILKYFFKFSREVIKYNFQSDLSSGLLSALKPPGDFTLIQNDILKMKDALNLVLKSLLEDVYVLIKG